MFRVAWERGGSGVGVYRVRSEVGEVRCAGWEVAQDRSERRCSRSITQTRNEVVLEVEIHDIRFAVDDNSVLVSLIYVIVLFR